jgi:hypothetical protein
MRSSRWTAIVLLCALLGACAAREQNGSDYPVFGKNAPMREVAGEVIGAATNWWGSRYIIVKDKSTGLHVYVQSVGATCVPRKSFRAIGHLTRAEGKDHEATFHLHLMDADKACG